MEVGLFLDLATEDTTVDEHLQAWRPLVALAERHGFTSVWAGESYPRGGGGFQHVPAPMLVLAALSGHTSMRLATGVTLLPVWDVLRLAYDAIVLDQLSGGRFELGVGLGSAPTWKQFGIDPATIGDRMDEQIAALRALWAGADGYQGTHVRIEGAIGPRPVAPAGPPIWVGGKIGRSCRRAATLGDGYLAGAHFGRDLVRRQVERYRDALTAAGKDPATGRIGLNRIVVLAEDPDVAWDQGAPYVERLLRRYAALRMFPGAAELAAAAPGDHDALRAAAEGMCLIGSPESVASEVALYAELGIAQVQVRPAPGGMPAELAARTIELAGRMIERP
jgi:alkanesulfonate monooxygenase SsuD/methylene tetrahydromethanopterin reductase-like flavin-dependent oxidoreductase (luciferase family)